MIALQNMRMSCDSTYLLDGKTDFGVKADELATLLDELLEEPGVKVVVFSQWLRMHELLARRLKTKRFGHVLFHGGLTGGQRKAMLDRFREDSGCRAFLATDAGGVGLNLQHASAVVNVDLPWNPAVLEQRIGRVHRLGQHKPVQVVNFIAEGTIEEGMLSVLKFKKSLFAGVLDGGEREVFLGGSRLSRFIDTVEKATATTDVPPERGSAPQAPGPTEQRGEPVVSAIPVPADGGADVWAPLIQTGLTLLEQFADALRPAAASGRTGLSLVHRDPTTGQDYLRIPVPKQEVLDRVLQSIGALLAQSDRSR